jgi:hypothetical protein
MNMTRFLCNKPSKGRTIRKVMGGGGEGKNKNRAGETERKKNSCTKKV